MIISLIATDILGAGYYMDGSEHLVDGPKNLEIEERTKDG